MHVIAETSRPATMARCHTASSCGWHWNDGAVVHRCRVRHRHRVRRLRLHAERRGRGRPHHRGGAERNRSRHQTTNCRTHHRVQHDLTLQAICICAFCGPSDHLRSAPAWPSTHTSRDVPANSGDRTDSWTNQRRLRRGRRPGEDTSAVTGARDAREFLFGPHASMAGQRRLRSTAMNLVNAPLICVADALTVLDQFAMRRGSSPGTGTVASTTNSPERRTKPASGNGSAESVNVPVT